MSCLSRASLRAAGAEVPLSSTGFKFLILEYYQCSPIPWPATGVSRALRARSVPRVSDGVSLGPFGPRTPECPKSVPRVSPECPGHLFDTPGTLSGLYFWTLRSPGPEGPSNGRKCLKVSSTKSEIILEPFPLKRRKPPRRHQVFQYNAKTKTLEKSQRQENVLVNPFMCCTKMTKFSTKVLGFKSRGMNSNQSSS